MNRILKLSLALFVGVCVFVLLMRSLPKSVQNTLLAAKPELPLSVTSRKALLGPGAVAQIRNNGPRELPLILHFSNHTFKRSTNFDCLISPEETLEIGHLQGWAMASGDELVVSSEGYNDLKVSLK